MQEYGKIYTTYSHRDDGIVVIAVKVKEAVQKVRLGAKRNEEKCFSYRRRTPLRGALTPNWSVRSNLLLCVSHLFPLFLQGV